MGSTDKICRKERIRRNPGFKIVIWFLTKELDLLQMMRSKQLMRSNFKEHGEGLGRKNHIM